MSLPQSKARYIMIGGFLGAGKTTAISKFAQHLHQRGLKVGLITNDQGSQLVDTTFLSSRGFPVEEISGGCFCCRFNSLTEAARKLSAENRPDVFLAEPVGSCTDLVATVTYPLRRMYGDQFTIAPFSVLMDPVRALRILGEEPGGKFSDKVLYIYRKQLEEADLLVVNKADLLSPERLSKLRSALQREFPDRKIVEISARTETGLTPWFDFVSSGEQIARAAMQVDYDVYADGEALLGWLNATLAVRALPSSTSNAASKEARFDANQVVRTLAHSIQTKLAQLDSEIAHLKMTLDSSEGLGDLAVINLVRNDFVPELSQSAQDPMKHGELILNLRAEGDPESLRAAMEFGIQQTLDALPGLEIKLQDLEHFKPGRPTPTHRIS